MDEFVLLCTCDGPVITQRVLAQLADAGVPARVDGQHADALFGGIAIGGPRIMVPKSSLAEAEQLLDDFDASEPPDLESDDDGGEDLVPDKSVEYWVEREAETSTKAAGARDDAMPRRFSPWVRLYLSAYTWPVLLISSLVCLATGRFGKGIILCVMSLMAWGITRPSPEEDAEEEDAEEAISGKSDHA